MMHECKAKERLCQKCGESGDLRDACKTIEVCRNCKVKGQDSSHSVLSPECPECVRMYAREKACISND